MTLRRSPVASPLFRLGLAGVIAAAAAGARGAETLSAYLRLAELYRSGAHAEAVRQLGAWEPSHTAESAEALLDAWLDARIGEAAFTRLAQAAVLMHAELSLATAERVFAETGPGLEFTVIGKSLLGDQTIQKTSKTQLKISFPVKKAFLIWSGEVKEHNKNAEKIRFLGPKNKEHRVTAQHIWKINSTGILYSALADVSKYVTGGGSYGVKNLSSDMINPGGKDPYSVGGWVLLVVTENRKSKKNSSVTLLAGLQVLKPGETYDLSLTPHLPKGFVKPQVIGIIGGHGRAGNGSGNLYNGLAMSGQDDWDGSAGKFWDVDLFKFNPDTNYVNKRGDSTVTIDPLLQWLYPIGVIVKSQSTE